MLLLDLRWLLFYILIALFAAALLAAWLARRLGAPAPRLGSSWTALERAPFALLVLQEPQRYRYANAQARRWLDLSASDGVLPQAEWVPLLEGDREVLAEGAPGQFKEQVADRVQLVTPPPGTSRRSVWSACPARTIFLIFFTLKSFINIK